MHTTHEPSTMNSHPANARRRGNDCQVPRIPARPRAYRHPEPPPARMKPGAGRASGGSRVSGCPPRHQAPWWSMPRTSGAGGWGGSPSLAGPVEACMPVTVGVGVRRQLQDDC